MKPIRVLIVEDSPTVQSVLRSILSASADIEIVATASDAFEAKDLIMKMGPDVITLDIEMPRMDGITFLKRLMAFRAIPVIMISSYTRANSLRTLEALDAGAVDFVAKPTKDVKTGLQELKYEITAKVRAAARANMRPRLPFAKPQEPPPMARIKSSHKVIVLGASTGGTYAIRRLLGSMPSDVSPIVIVQHMPSGFTKAFATQLNSMLTLQVKEAEDGDRLTRGKVVVAPGGWHLEVAKDSDGYCIRLQDGRPVNHQRPSVDVCFHSAAKAAGRDAVGVILTGMGSDGADGLLAMRQAGALTVAQDDTTSLVFGMPLAAIERGGVEVVAALENIAGIVLGALA
ncbi:MAG: chemotaxis response regulator protein-glutamate methylesterase [Thermodesulfobacteriota bacterium]|nr:chemotaxis response regulator protein-glutamate methylesterase [Thermodesulfobacteriota bacterium]